MLQRCVVILLMLAPCSAFAQSAPPAWASKVKFGRPLFLTTASGERVEGTAGQVTGDAVVVATPAGIRTVPHADIVKVQKRDSLWTGPAYGAGAGLVLGLLVLADDDTCPDSSAACRDEAGAVAVGMAMYGALIGWGIDALIKNRTTIFERQAGRGTNVSIGFSGRAVRATLRF